MTRSFKGVILRKKSNHSSAEIRQINSTPEIRQKNSTPEIRVGNSTKVPIPRIFIQRKYMEIKISGQGKN